MKSKFLKVEAQTAKEVKCQDIGDVYTDDLCRCTHIEKVLPFDLTCKTLPNEGLDKLYLTEPVHALHLQSILDEGSNISLSFGEEQKRSEAINSSGLSEMYLPNRSVTITQNACVKKRKVQTLPIEADATAAPPSGDDTKKQSPVKVKEEQKGTIKSSNVISSGAKPVVAAEDKSTTPSKLNTKVSPNDETKSSTETLKPAQTSTETKSRFESEKKDSETKNASENEIQADTMKLSYSTSKPQASVAMVPSSGAEKAVAAKKQVDSASPTPTTTTSSGPSTAASTTSSLPIIKMDLPDDRFQQFRRAENQILLQRRAVFYKRADKRKRKKSDSSKKRNSSSSSETPSKSTVSAAATSMASSSWVINVEEWNKQANQARDKGETWMHHFRKSRQHYWSMEKRNTVNLLPTCQKCPHDKFQGDDMMICLDCGYVGCSPHSISPNSKQHMIMHMLSTNHKLAVTCGERNRIYCFGCGDVIQHQLFDTERERIDVENTLPKWSWREHPIYRSFNASNFISSPEHGVFWRGLVATYPSLVPQQHLKAARMVYKRHLVSKNPTICAPVGLYNLGNTCFMNGILQCLIHTPPLQKHFLNEIGHEHHVCYFFRRNSADRGGSTPSCLACELDQLFLEYYGSNAGQNIVAQLDGEEHPRNIEKGIPLIPSTLLAAAWKQTEMSHLKGYEQRDAHEFLQAFLDVVGKHAKPYNTTIEKNREAAMALSMDCKSSTPSGDIIKNLFEGTLRSVSICLECGSKRSLEEPFINVSLPLSEDTLLRFTSRKMNIQHCLKFFTAPESLSDPIECPFCEKKTSTKKQQTFSRLPKVLCLHLKRFDAAKNKKITDFVSFPSMGLDMGSFLPHWREMAIGAEPSDVEETKEPSAHPKILYDLFGTVNHSGNLNQGHYISNVKVDGAWYHCNDAHVSSTEESEVLKSEGAYMLFYIQRSRSTAA